jgi:tRNA C32,U32 (ribose-2'-O)-methylase TrmJ
MNLGQAVAVCAYELARAGLVPTRPLRLTVHLSEPAGTQSLDRLFDRAARVLDQVGYLKPKSRRATLLKLRRLILDLELTNHDARILGGILAQIEWKIGKSNSESEVCTLRTEPRFRVEWHIQKSPSKKETIQ